MAVVPSSVRVAPDSTGKRIDNVSVTTPEGLVERQVIVPGDPEDPDARQAVRNATPAVDDYGSVVRPAPPNFDSGNLPVPDTDTEVTPETLYLRNVLLVNVTDQIQQVSVTDAAANPYISEFPLAPRESKLFPFGGLLVVGVHWSAFNADAVRGQVNGET